MNIKIGTDEPVSGMIGTHSFTDTRFSGSGPQIGVEYESNDFCACLSKGVFDKRRAEIFREHDNPELDSYIVYDLQKLKEAIKKVLLNELNFDWVIVGSLIHYKEKDEYQNVGKLFNYNIDIKDFNKWRVINFVKPFIFAHEEEYRILILDTHKIGQLDQNTAALKIGPHPSIAAAIVDHGSF